MSDPIDPVARFKRHQEEAAADSEHALSVRALKKICDVFKIDPDLRYDDPDFGFGWFNTNYSTFPLKLESRRIQIDDINPMVKSLIKSPAWKVYVDILQMYEFEPCGVIVNYKGSGLWVMHNAWHLPPPLGHVRFSARARTAGEGLIFESLNAFLDSVKEVWSA